MEIGKSIGVRLKLGRSAAQTGAEQAAARTGQKIAKAGQKIEKGNIVRSEAGRDRGKLFLTLAEEGEYLLLADGKGRKLESPKRKKRRHVSFVSARETRVSRKILGGEKLSNSELRRTLAAFREAADQEG